MKNSSSSYRFRAAAAWSAISALVICLALGPGPSLAKDGPAGKKKVDLKKRLEQLRSVPYATTSPEEAAEGENGVSVHDIARAYRGYNLYAVPGSPDAVLMDMQGAVVHQWTCRSPDIKGFNDVIMLPSGDLIAVIETFGLLALDWDSNLLWERKMNAHHDVARSEDGTYFVLSYEMIKHRDLEFRFDTMVELSARMEPIREWSTHKRLDEIKAAFDQSSFIDVLLDSMLAEGLPLEPEDDVAGRIGVRDMKDGAKAYDYFHLNTITLLPDTPLGRSDPRFKAGNILTCARNVNQIAILDRETFEILWVWGEGHLQWPHHPTMLSNGNILIFDNGVLREYSSIIELNPVTLAIQWQYVANPPEAFYTERSGSAQRLPNGNTLICEGRRGRTFEVTREGETVWEWLNPVLKNGHRVSVYRMMRLPPEIVEPLLR